jgi:hypothetical protein
MPISFDLLPVELQASVVELRASGVPDATIETLIDRTLAALAVKANRDQAQVWQIGIDLRAQLAQIGTTLQADLQTQFGATNTMVVDLRAAVQEAGQGIADIKKQWSELDQWRGRVEAALVAVGEFRGESTKDRADLRAIVLQQDTRHGRQITMLTDEFRRVGEQLLTLGARLATIEQLLEIAGQHEAGG